MTSFLERDGQHCELAVTHLEFGYNIFETDQASLVVYSCDVCSIIYNRGFPRKYLFPCSS